jgi:hypothetical protein
MSDHDLEKWSGRAKPGMPVFDGPQDVRDAFIKAKGIDWTASYIDPATWIPPSRTLVSFTGYGFDQIMQGASKICAHLGITVREGGERLKIRQAQEDYEARTNPPRRSFAHRDAAA